MEYNHKKKINEKIKKITNKEILHEIYNIVNNYLPDNKLTINNNGVYFDLNKLPDNIILDIETVLNEHLITTDTENS